MENPVENGDYVNDEMFGVTMEYLPIWWNKARFHRGMFGKGWALTVEKVVEIAQNQLEHPFIEKIM